MSIADPATHTDHEIGAEAVIVRQRAEIDRLRAILYNVALSMGAEDSEQFMKHIGWTHTAAIGAADAE